MSAWKKAGPHAITNGAWLIEKFQRQQNGEWIPAHNYVLHRIERGGRREFVAGPFDSAEQAKARIPA